MEIVMDVLFGFGGFAIVLASTAGIVALLVVINMTSRFFGKRLARYHPKIDMIRLCQWVCLTSAVVAMAVTFIGVDDATTSVTAFIVVIALKGVLGVIVATLVATLTYLLAGLPLREGFAEQLQS